MLVVWISTVFMLFGIAFSACSLSGRPTGNATSRRRRVWPLARAVSFVRDADLHLARKPRLLGEATAWQIAILPACFPAGSGRSRPAPS